MFKFSSASLLIYQAVFVLIASSNKTSILDTDETLQEYRRTLQIERNELDNITKILKQFPEESTATEAQVYRHKYYFQSSLVDNLEGKIEVRTYMLTRNKTSSDESD